MPARARTGRAHNREAPRAIIPPAMDRLSDYRYELPEELIAQHPAAERSASRLLHLDGADGRIQHRRFSELPELLDAGDLVVFNDTRVIPARLPARKESGGRAEILVERILAPDRCLAHVRASRSPKPGTRLVVGEYRLEVAGRDADLFILQSPDIGLMDLLETHGHMPLPPYIQRPDEALDRDRYQTVYAREAGAVAAPTAGLHFDDAMLARLEAAGIQQARVTLHVGAGTFQPVRSDDLDAHRMHAEWLRVPEGTCRAVAETRERGGKVIAVGTTVVRALETAAKEGELAPFEGETRLFIRPGYRFQVIDRLLTNFHLPESTLLMLVCAFGGYRQVLQAYGEAVAERYRFFSYGDAMLIDPAPEARDSFPETAP